MDREVNTDNLENFDESRLWKVIGANARKARDFAGLTQQEAQALIFNYKNKTMFANRISEIESGNKKIDSKILYKMAIVYQVSTDFFYGLTSDPELNIAASHNGLLHASMRGIMLEVGDRLTESLHGIMRYFPPFQGEMLNTNAKHLVEAIRKHKSNLVFKCEYPEILHAAGALAESIRDFETYKARQARLVEMQMCTHLDDVEKQVISTMNNSFQKIDSEKLD